MSVKFTVENHLYESLDPNEKIDWLSVTRFLEMFKEKFDPVAISIKCSKNKKSKWYGMDPVIIQGIWSAEGERAADTGNFYHGQREADVIDLDTLDRNGIAIPIIKPIYEGNVKLAPVQKLVNGIYPEHFVYLKSAGICGQSDRVEVVNNYVDIIDYKTNKEIKREGFKNWEGLTKKMVGPCAHLDDCNYNHYTVQLSLYMHIILKHNPGLKPGKLVLHHIIFEKDYEDAYGYPIYKKDTEGNYIVKTLVPYEVPYLKDEVRAMINWYLQHKVS